MPERDESEEAVEKTERWDCFPVFGSSRTDSPRSELPGLSPFGAGRTREDVEKAETSSGRCGGAKSQGNPERGREMGGRGEARGEVIGEGLGSWRSSPGDRGGRIGAPLVETRYVLCEESGEAMGARRFISTTLTAFPSESRLAMLTGTLPLIPPYADNLPPSSSPNAPRFVSSTESDDECGGM